MSKATKLNELHKDTPFYMVISDFEVTGEDGNIVAFKCFDVVMTVQRKEYVNSVKYYMCRASENNDNTNFVIRLGDEAFNHLIKTSFAD